MTFRPLTGPEMEDCEAAVTRRALDKLGDQIEAFSKIAEDRKGEKQLARPPTETEELETAKGQIDAQTALPMAIVAWSYKWPEEAEAEGPHVAGEAIPVNPGNVADLDDRTWSWAHEVVVRMNKLPPPSGSDS